MEKYNQAIRQLQEAELGVKIAEDIKSDAVQSLTDMVLPRLKALYENFPDTFGRDGSERQPFEMASDGDLRRIPVISKGKSVVDGVSTVEVISFSFKYRDPYNGDVDYVTFDVPTPYLRDDWEETLAKDLAARNKILDAENAKVAAKEEADERRLFEGLRGKYENGPSLTKPENADLYRQILDSVAHIPT